MGSRFDRRLLLKSAAGAGAAAALTKASPIYAAPAIIQSGPTEVLFWSSFSANLGESMQALVDEFNASQSEIVINNQFQGSYEETAQKITAALPANQGPDMSILSEIWWFRFYAAQALAPLDDLISGAQLDTADYVDSLINEGNRGGAQWWIPFARSTPLFYYDKQAFAEVGLNESPKTWDEFVAVAPELVRKDGDTTTRHAFAHVTAAGYIAWHFQGVVWQWGGRYSDENFDIMIDEEPAVAAADFYKKSVGDGWANMSSDATADFNSGLATAMFASTGSLGGVMQNATVDVGTGFFPEGPAGFGCCTGGSGLSIFKNAAPEKQAAAFEFMKWATTPEKTTWWSQNTGYMPVRKSARDSEDMQAFFAENPNFKVAVEQLQFTKPQDPARIYIPNGDQIIGTALEQIMIEQDDAAAVFENTAFELEDEAQPVLEQLSEIEG
jgi:sn-glycerol 3-phosphate transport system substrate-binding protein